MSLQSALYEGRVRHRRFGSPKHRLSYALFMAYIDLDEVDRVVGLSSFWSSRFSLFAWLRRRDYFGDAGRPWADEVRDFVAAETGRRPSGPVRLLTNPRTFGFRMNPVSIYYCFGDEGLEAIVAEVTNTPWGERHLYVVHRDHASILSSSEKKESWRVDLDKSFHVSPFLPMHMRYRWILDRPGDRLVFHMENHREQEKVHDATLLLERREISPSSLRGLLVRHAFLTLRIFLRIYWNALLLALKGARFHAHPKHMESRAR